MSHFYVYSFREIFNILNFRFFLKANTSSRITGVLHFPLKNKRKINMRDFRSQTGGVFGTYNISGEIRT